MQCRICGNIKDNKGYVFREMFFGTREEFSYFECSECGCIQINDIPDDMSTHYPDDYYSFSEPLQHLPKNPVKRALRLKRDRAAVFGGDPIGSLLLRLHPTLTGASRTLQLRRARLSFSSRILDVGCGGGSFLSVLDAIGFTDLTGVDPYIGGDLQIGNHARIHKAEMSELDPAFDVIMLHWVLEHLADQDDAFRQMARLMADDSLCVVSIPIVPCYAWRHYGAHWVELDPPRHTYIHSLKSIEILAKRYGLEIAAVDYETSAHTLWCSEQYARDIPLTAPNSYGNNPKNSIFAASDLRKFDKLAKRLNRKKDGDLCAISLQRRR